MPHRLKDPTAVLSAVAEMGKELIKNCVSVESLSRTTLHYARLITGSEHGVVSAIDPVTKANIGFTLTDMMGESCNIPDGTQRIAFPPLPDGTYPGLWGHALNTKLGFYTNEPCAHPATRGLPEGHIPLHNYLAVPARIGNEVLGEISLANKKGKFNDSDLWVAHLLCEVYAAALQRNRTESLLRESNERARVTLEGRYKAFLSASPDMLHLICRDGVFIDTHPGLIPVVLKPSEYIGKNVRDVFPPEFADQALKYLHEALETGRIVEWEYSIPKVPGHTFEARMSPSGPDEVLVVIRDISRSRDIQTRLEGMVEDRTQQLQATNDALQSFAYAASHDLREPLSKIRAFGNRLKDILGDKLPPKAEEYLDIMLNASTRMTQLIDDLLNYSRAGGVEEAEFMPVDLNKLVAEILADLDMQLTETEAEVKVGFLPIIEGHSAQFRVVFQNLISNALKFKHPDRSPIVRLEGVRSAKAFTITITDNGIGFDQKFAEQIFNVFTRLHTRFDFPGTGIGLSLCRRILSHYGGSIRADGVPNLGATFTITLPIRNTEDTPHG